MIRRRGQAGPTGQKTISQSKPDVTLSTFNHQSPVLRQIKDNIESISCSDKCHLRDLLHVNVLTDTLDRDGWHKINDITVSSHS